MKGGLSRDMASAYDPEFHKSASSDEEIAAKRAKAEFACCTEKSSG
jgi:hypothetical protein